MSQLGTIALKVSNFNHLKQLHAHIIHNSLHHHNYWVAQLIGHCTRLQAPPPYTRLIFNSTHHPNVFVFNNMLKFYSQLGAHNDVINMFDKMRNLGVRPDAFMYPILMKSAGEAEIFLHGHLLKLGHCCDRYVCNAIMDVYAKHGPIEVARELFDEICERAIADWNLMISGYWNWGKEVEACSLFEVMPEKNVVTWTAMITGYSKIKDLVSAIWYFDQMLEKSVVSWNAMLSQYLTKAGIQPNERTWVAVISSCSSRGDPCLAETLVKMLNERGIQLNCFVKTTLLDMYAKCGSLNTARKIFDKLGLYRNSFTWNAMVSAYAWVGDLASAKELFDMMLEKNVALNSMITDYTQNGQSASAIGLFKEMILNKDLKPDEVTMVSVISACGHLGALEVGNWIVNFLTPNQISLSISGYNSLIFMYSKCGSIKDAKNVFQEMKTRDIYSYNTLITGYATYGPVALMHKMKDEGIEPDRITYIGVLTACNHVGLLKEDQKVFESIKAPDTDHFVCMIIEKTGSHKYTKINTNTLLDK